MIEYSTAIRNMPIKLLFENDKLRISDRRVPPGGVESTTHHLPTIVWQVLAEDQPSPTPLALEPGSSSEVDNRAGGHEQRDIIFEILLAAPRFNTSEVAQLSAAAAPYDTSPGQALGLENDRVRCWDFRSSLGMHKSSFHQHMYVRPGGRPCVVFSLL